MHSRDDYLDKLIIETLKRKPVNSDHFCIVRKIQPGEVFTKHPNREIINSHIPISRRIKETLDTAGFHYGRLKHPSLIPSNGSNKVRMLAPGPTISKIEEEVPKVFFEDEFKVKYPHGFDKAPIEYISSRSFEAKKPSQASTVKFLSMSPSQRQAKEYLQYLTAITSDEKKVLQQKIDSKVNDFKKSLYEQVPKVVSNYNNRGVFSTEINEMRANSMLSVKLKNQMKIKLEPIVRKVKADVLKEKMQEYNENSEKVVMAIDIYQQEADKRNKLLKYVGETVSKNGVTKGENQLNSTLYNSDHDWKESLTEIMNKAKARCTPKFLVNTY